MDKNLLKKLIDVASGRIPADLVIKNARIIDVYNSSILYGKDIAICDGYIAGIGDYKGFEILDAKGQFASPGFIDSHIHIESSYVTPEEIGRLLIPRGGTTIIADPHELVNVCGLAGMNYMLEASQATKLDIKFMLPSCVPSTPFEHAGAILDAASMEEPILLDQILGLGEFMNYPGVVQADDEVLNKLLVAIQNKKIIDGHSPSLTGNPLNAYAVAGIRTDHECSTPEEIQDRITRGIYVLLREGSACHDLHANLKSVTPANSRRFLLCSDDRQPKTIRQEGHLDNHLRICVEEGIDPLIAIQMATINAAECYCLQDRGAIAPGLRADIVLFDSLKDFIVSKVLIQGELVAVDGNYLPDVMRCDYSAVRSQFKVNNFTKDRLSLRPTSPKVNVIQILQGGVLTARKTASIQVDEQGEFLYNPKQDIVKIAVIERHQCTGNVAVALLQGYGIKSGAIALSIAHDSHNIITVGTNDDDIAYAVEQLIEQGGGILLAQNRQVISSMPMVIGGIMSDQSGEWVEERLEQIHKDAREKLGISEELDPVMTLCFMSLPVIPELKITDMGLFDVNKFEFIPIEAEE